MFGERRKHQRVAINRTARIQAESGAVSRECTITDISDHGARLFAGDVEVPDQFYLLISGDKPIRHECRVAWRLGGEMGVEFVTNADQTRLDAMKRVSEDARKAFRPAN